MLKRSGVPHKVSTPKHHEQEAEIVSKAGQAGAVTILDQHGWPRYGHRARAGCGRRGRASHHRHERHEARRIDNQLRGPAGRQATRDHPASNLSLEDDLMRIFAADRLSGLMQRIGMAEDEPTSTA